MNINTILLLLINSASGIHGSFFPDSTAAAYANYILWNSLGFSIALAYDSFVCTNIKLYIIIPFLVVGCTLVYVLEGIVKREKVHASESGSVHPTLLSESRLDLDIN